MGRIDEILPAIPIYLSDISRRIFERVFIFSKSKGKIARRTINIEDQKPFRIKDMIITPFVIDHSAYSSFMFLLEAENKRILFMCDYRNHGYKGKLLKPTLKKIGKIDILITEGTTLSREQVKAQTEAELAIEMAEKTKKYGQVLVLMSTTNIDRVTTITRVANKTSKTLIHDILLSNVLQLCTQKIPNALNSKKVQVFLPSFIYLLKDKEEYRPYIEPYKEKMKLTGKALHR